MKKRVKAGRQRHWLTFESLVVENDSDGRTVEDWVPAFDPNPTMPCEVTPIIGREFLAGSALQSKVTHKIRVRFRPGFADDGAKMRGVTKGGGLVYNIEAAIPDPDSMRRYITLLASSGVSPGN